MSALAFLAILAVLGLVIYVLVALAVAGEGCRIVETATRENVPPGDEAVLFAKRRRRRTTPPRYDQPMEVGWDEETHLALPPFDVDGRNPNGH
jgi:hypothetical protein